MSSVAQESVIVGKRVENRIVREADKRRTRDLGAVGLVLAPIALVLLVFAWENVEAIRRGYELRRIRAERERLSEENRRLRSRLGALSSLPDAERRARAELGFVDPNPSQVVHVRSAGSGIQKDGGAPRPGSEAAP